jgi:hypothetical protein
MKISQSLKNSASIWGFLLKIKQNNFLLIFESHCPSQLCLWLSSELMREKVKGFMRKIDHSFKQHRDWYLEMISKTDYVPTTFIYHLLLYFPNLIDHLRYKRYLWDSKSMLEKYSNDINGP